MISKKIQNTLIKNRKLLFGLIFVLSTLLIFLPLVFKARFEHLRALGLVGILVINFLGSATVFIPTPAIISVGVGGELYNPFLVSLFASIGSSLGESTGFIFGLSSKEVLDLKKNAILNTLNKSFLKKYGAFAIFMFSLIPNPFFDGIGILVGLSSYPLVKFVSLVFAGRFLRNLLIAFLGSKL